MDTEGRVNHGYTHLEEEDVNGILKGGDADQSTALSWVEGDGMDVRPKDETEEIKDAEAKTEEQFPPVGFFSLFRYSSCCDKLLIALATVVAIASGFAIPALTIYFGQVVDEYIQFDIAMKNWTNETDNETITNNFLHATANSCMWLSLFGGSFFIVNYVMVSFFSLTAANQAYHIRCRFMQAVLKQDITWFDSHQTGDFATRITGDLTRIQDGIGDKAGICVNFLTSTLLCAGLGIYLGWKLALVIFCITPVLVVSAAILTKIQATVSTQELEAYGTAGAVAEEVLSSIRTVVAFGGQRKEMDRYEACLIPASRKGIKRGLLTGISAGLLWFCIFAGYALAFWYGVKLIVQDKDDPHPEYTGGKLITIFCSVFTAAMAIGQTAPYFEAFAQAKGAAAKIFSIIDRVPAIDSSSDRGMRPLHLEGHVRLKDVHFNYPARPTVPILKGLSLEVKPGETVALVGSSGCGKSTIVQLLLRFYDTDSGSVELDGIDVKQLNLGWMRDQIGLVGQEPVLFSTTVEENIRMGRKDASWDEIEQAAKTANAHDFIQGLPMKYQTLVGERGTQMSGGQRQRIAIARAIVRNPRILLLDEATSALDTESEAVVQAALDEARRGRTTLVVAHRLSTIRTADKIVVLDEGVVKETGTHDELMLVKGLYYQLVVAQSQHEEKEEEQDEEESEDLPDLERHSSFLSSGSEDPTIRRPSLNRQISAISRQISTTSNKTKEADEEEEEEEEPTSLPKGRLFELSAKEWPYALVGSLAAVIMGAHFPAFGIMFGSILGLLAESTDVIEEKNSLFCLIFLLMAISAFTCNFLQVFMFSVAGEKLTFRLRKMLFANIITQDIGYFDNSKNSVGSLCSRLNSDASSVQGATGSRIATALRALSTMVFATFLAFFYNWKIGLVSMSTMPLLLLATAIETRVVRGHMHSEKEGMEKASKIATEAIESIRTVASLHQEETFYDQYCLALSEPHKKSRTMSHVRGMAHGFGQAIGPLAFATGFYYGSRLMASNEIQYTDLLKVVEGILVSAQNMGQAVAFTPDYVKAKVAANRIFRQLDIRPVIDALSNFGLTKNSVEGSVDFSNVHFSYPSRPQLRVLRGLQATVQPGKTVALVGSSGCGKSTCIQLLERFYDPNKGKVMVDSTEVMELNVANHRSHMALVSQEPVLFDRSIAENIAYGDNSRQPDMAEIIEAARQANIHQFVSALPQGYDTSVGDRGTQLSGGQKQRIAIARALIRNPRILLLDEATSALDTESEKVVQEALDVARSGRTCLVIAHRLTTIQNADTILVLNRGRIVEKGTHQELINKKGFYYGLHRDKTLDVRS